jgi:chromosome segregation ATPase
MRALQDRITELEETQLSYALKLREVQTKTAETDSIWRARLAEEVKTSQEQRQKSSQEISKLEDRLSRASETERAQSCKLAELEGQVKQLSEALKEADEQLKAAEVRRQTEVVQAQSDRRTDELERLKAEAQQSSYEVHLLTAELKYSQSAVLCLKRELANAQETLYGHNSSRPQLTNFPDLPHKLSKELPSRQIAELSCKVEALQQQVEAVESEKENLRNY